MNQYRRIALSLSIAAIAIVPPAVALAAPPANDNFADATVIGAAGGTFASTNAEATAESFEPDHASSTFGAVHSVWFSWTAQASGEVLVHTCNSAFNTRLGVYTGSSVDALAVVTDNEDSSGATCGGTGWAELTFAATAGTTYRIAVDTSGGITPAGVVDNGNPPQGAINFVVQPPASPDPADDKTNPATPVPPAVRKIRVPRLIASCGDDTPRGNNHCKQGPYEFHTAANVNTFLERLRRVGVPSLLKDTSAVTSSKAKTQGEIKALRERGTGGEITFADIELEFANGEDTTLEQGKKYTVATNDLITVRYNYFDLARDGRALADEKQELRKQAEREARRNDPPKSKCLPIAADESNKQILDRFPPDAGGYRSYLDMFDGLAKLGCQVEIEKFVRGKPSAPRSYVKDVVGRDAKRATISVVYAQPGSHDFVFAIREHASQWLANQNKNSIPLGTDGQLTVSDTQVNRFTVQVIERASGRFVAGVPVAFNGKTQTTDGNGETTFASLLRTKGDYRLSAEYKEMEGWRTIRAADRGRKSFTSMAGRNIKASQGRFVGNDPAQLEFASKLPILPANLGTGDSGDVISIPQIKQATVTTFDRAGNPITGQHNVVELANNSNVLVGAGPGLLALGGGTGAQVGRKAARFGIPNPLDYLSQILGGVKSAIDSGVANVRTALDGANQAAIAFMSQALSSPSSNLISDKGLGVISTGGGNLIGQAGGNLISDKGLGVISVGGGNLIGQAGGNLIGQAGGNLISDKGLGVISTGGGNLTPVFGGRIISRDGAS